MWPTTSRSDAEIQDHLHVSAYAVRLILFHLRSDEDLGLMPSLGFSFRVMENQFGNVHAQETRQVSNLSSPV